MQSLLIDILDWFKKSESNITVLTGAGVSAESGIPTFRGGDGFWTMGSKNYTPEEMGTLRLFRENPYRSWEWYLYRRGISLAANPNPAHVAIAKLENYFQDHFRLITQNSDGLHLRAGNTEKCTHQVHGNIHTMRCLAECTQELFPMPDDLYLIDRDHTTNEEQRRLLTCPYCKDIARPHLLWFDECYNNHYYQIETIRSRAQKTQLLIVVGTSAAANIPGQIVRAVRRAEGAIIDINPQNDPISDLAQSATRGIWCQGKAGELLPEIVDYLIK